MCVKKILSFAASIIKLFIIIIFITDSRADDNNIKYYSNDMGILSLMYHRFDEDKYPSTNIQMDVFKKQIQIIKDLNYSFFNPGNYNGSPLRLSVDPRKLRQRERCRLSLLLMRLCASGAGLPRCL